MKDFSVITVCTHSPSEPYYCLPQFFKSCRDEQPILLDKSFAPYTGLGSKPKMLYKAIKEKKLNTKYFIFCDCFDLVFTFGPHALLWDFDARFDSPIVFSSEKNCFPEDLKSDYDQLPATSSYKYLNSGMIVGETDAMLTILEAMDLSNVPDDYRMENGNMYHVNDQFLYQQIFLKQPVKMKLDYWQLLCNTLHGVKPEELQFGSDGIRNVETGIYPFSFHLNGSSKTDGLREPILKHLRLL